MLLGLGEGADDCYLNSQGREKCQLLMAYHYVTKPDSFSVASKSVAGETFVQNTVKCFGGKPCGTCKGTKSGSRDASFACSDVQLDKIVRLCSCIRTYSTLF
jgi:hypothetical protein